MESAAAIAMAMFFGLSAPISTPRPSDFTGANIARPSIHLGREAGSPAFGAERNLAIAATRSATPRAIRMPPAPVAVPVPAARSTVPAIATSAPSIAATPTTKPTT